MIIKKPHLRQWVLDAETVWSPKALIRTSPYTVRLYLSSASIVSLLIFFERRTADYLVYDLLDFTHSNTRPSFRSAPNASPRQLWVVWFCNHPIASLSYLRVKLAFKCYPIEPRYRYALQEGPTTNSTLQPCRVECQVREQWPRMTRLIWWWFILTKRSQGNLLTGASRR